MAGRALFLITGVLFIGVLPCLAPPVAAAASGDGGWRWPLRPAPPRVVGVFDPPGSPWGPGHRGIDLAAPVRQPVYAAGAGRIGYAGRLAGRGVVTVVHGSLRTTYVPVSPVVRRGQQVGAGRQIGTMEDSLAHCGALNCLHLGLLRGAVYLDPLSLFGGRIRLLPVWALPGATATATVTGAAAGRSGGLAAPGQGGSPSGPARSPAPDRGAAPGTRGAAPATRPPPQAPAQTAPMTATSAAAGGAGMALLLVVMVRVAREVIRSGRRRRLPLGVVDFVRERERRRGGPG